MVSAGAGLYGSKNVVGPPSWQAVAECQKVIGLHLLLSLANVLSHSWRRTDSQRTHNQPSTECGCPGHNLDNASSELNQNLSIYNSVCPRNHCQRSDLCSNTV
jgi:hypothetical protein